MSEPSSSVKDKAAPKESIHAVPPAGPCAVVIFGAGGDLTKRLVAPALYNLARTHLLPENFALIGVDLADLTAEQWRDNLHTTLKGFIDATSSEFVIDSIDERAWNWLSERMSYVKGDITDGAVYTQLATALEQVAAQHKTQGNVLFYLAVADRFFATVVDHLGRAQLVTENKPVTETKPATDKPSTGNTETEKNNSATANAENANSNWRRVVIEKPFGHDLGSAKALNADILKTLREEQIYRIDHFLGKETVQNIMAVRFANGLFEPIWNRDHIDHIQITVAETVGVETRGRFYEQTGCLRDMVPNHVFQLLGMIAMEPPTSFSADAIRSRKFDVFASLRPLQPEDAVRGQYAAGTVLDKSVRAYREEPNVAPDSNIETYVALKLAIDNWRWAGVPFYLRTGKYLTRRDTEIAVRFKQAPYSLFEHTEVDALSPNWLILQIQPDEGISLQFNAKRPGPSIDLAPVSMDFSYKDWFEKEPNVGYETLIYDCMIGDPTLFQRADTVEAGWRVVQPILDAWGATKEKDFPNYVAGSSGPAAADELIQRDGNRQWRPIVDDNGKRK
ncbi:MAG: glucose-6-phosphate dehydrogenase [Verrucomicrobiaceae bacterium]|nr:glucose-6-phosphate dehydrogenase [Verrucomicrobiaceae bacterium]